jgi:hypothetical protein
MGENLTNEKRMDKNYLSSSAVIIRNYFFNRRWIIKVKRKYLTCAMK